MDLMNLIVPRQELNTGTILNLDNEQCIISSVRGKGASSIVYEATLNNRRIILKELYPTSMGILRTANSSLIIPEKQKDKFQNAKMALKRAFDLQLQFFNDFPNHIVEPQKLYEYNNTLYIVMHLSNGSSYDDVKPTDILAIFEVAKSLSAAIGFYHKKGYLNLDIKPENLFIFPETNQLIQLFDFDTVATKEDVMQGRFSYSHSYAAPEVRGSRNGNAKLSDIDERADIFSIGVVIFEKVMGRIPDYSDHREGKIWDFSSNPYLKNTVPPLQTGITELFRKTIAREKNDRYLSVAELIKDLDKLIKLESIKVFLKSQNISPCTAKNIYIQRKNVCDNIYKTLNLYHILYLYTIRGNGKSETAREYAETYADKYNFIQSIFYSQNLKKTIANLDFVGLKPEDKIAHTDEDIDRLYSYKLDLLGNTDIYTSNTLLVIDNYDYDSNPKSEEYKQNVKVLSDLRKLHIHIIFTTRINPTDKAHCFKLPDMSKQELEELFFRINPIQKDDPDRKKLVDEIIEASYNHTMTVKLVALQSKKYKKSLEEYLSKLKENGINSHIQGRITNEKDDESVTMSAVYDHIKALFNFDNLSDKEKYIMVNACLLPLEGLDTVTFSDFIDLDNFDGSSSDCIDESIEDLVNSGWISYTDSEETKISLHPLICDIATNELQPELTDEKCKKFYVSFLDLISEWGNNKANGLEYNNIQELVYFLFPKLYNLFYYNNILDAINCILLSFKNAYIKNYTIISDNTLIRYFGLDKKYIIPNSVTAIGDIAFDGCTSLTEISIPNSVTAIGDSAFDGCTSLTEISIPNSVTAIGDSTFSDCTSLTKIHISDSVKKIELNAFKGCTSLTEISIPNSVTAIGDSAFADCTSLTKIHISDSVKKIGNFAFFGCTSLTKIHISDSVKRIEDFAFCDCTSLTTIHIPDSVKKIGYGVFERCTALTTVHIPDSVKEIEWYAFCDCTSLATIHIPNSVKKIRNYAFADCTSLTKIHIPNSVRKIGNDAFKGCISLKGDQKLTEITIPPRKLKLFIKSDDVTKFKNRIFKQICKAKNRFLRKFTIPNNVTKIECYSFSGCTSLSKIYIPDSVKKIGNHAFEYCTLLTKIHIPDSVKKIGNFAFCGCTSLTKIHISDSVKKIGNFAFYGCTSLTKIHISDSVKRIEDYAFCDCTSLTTIHIPDSVKKIGNGVFEGCTALTTVHIPDSVKKIGNNAFCDCTSLSEVTIPNSVIEIGFHAFSKCTSLARVNIISNLVEICTSAFYCCTSLEEITIPQNVVYIGIEAFSYNTLSKITFLNSKIDISESYIGYYENEDGLYIKNTNLIIEGYKGSTAEEYAQENGFTFVPLDES